MQAPVSRSSGKDPAQVRHWQSFSGLGRWVTSTVRSFHFNQRCALPRRKWHHTDLTFKEKIPSDQLINSEELQLTDPSHIRRQCKAYGADVGAYVPRGLWTKPRHTQGWAAARPPHRPGGRPSLFCTQHPRVSAPQLTGLGPQTTGMRPQIAEPCSGHARYLGWPSHLSPTSLQPPLEQPLTTGLAWFPSGVLQGPEPVPGLGAALAGPHGQQEAEGKGLGLWPLCLAQLALIRSSPPLLWGCQLRCS